MKVGYLTLVVAAGVVGLVTTAASCSSSLGNASNTQGVGAPPDTSTLPPDTFTPPPDTSAPTPVPTLVPTPVPTSVPTPVPTPAGPTLTAQQQRAAEAAQQYLSMQGFSRQGLIAQLSSAYGDGYSVQDATVAVNGLNVDWNAEAVQAAKSYLAMEPFSCNNLIQQLDSSAGDQFTVAQATHGAHQAGAC